ncbi:MAG: LPS export ABC transporter periplasmic protein LptC [Aquificaceae bacterium]|nr:LPS export ABC transporter periplasmic protein LptC [Aquificaceae bacterium]
MSLIILFTSYYMRIYVDSYKSDRSEEKIVNVLQGITIKSYSKNGIEWTIRGEKLEVVSKDVKITKAELFSDEANIRAENAYIDRSTGKGELIGNVVLTSKNLMLRSQRVHMDLKEGKFNGEDRVDMIEGKNKVEGDGFHLTLKPLQVIINRVRVKME